MAADLMMVCDTHGRIMYATTDLALSLGFAEARSMYGVDLNTLISQPYRQLHVAWMKVRGRNAAGPPQNFNKKG
jgi:hypothetical protein